jgi:hypothetical protein
MIARTTLPQPTRCPHCGFVAAQLICSICKTERPILAKLRGSIAQNIVARIEIGDENAGEALHVMHQACPDTETLH